MEKEGGQEIKISAHDIADDHIKEIYGFHIVTYHHTEVNFSKEENPKL